MEGNLGIFGRKFCEKRNTVTGYNWLGRKKFFLKVETHLHCQNTLWWCNFKFA